MLKMILCGIHMMMVGEGGRRQREDTHGWRRREKGEKVTSERRIRDVTGQETDS